MIDRLRKEIQDRLDQLLAEAEKLRRALVALDPRAGNSSTTSRRPAAKQPAPTAPATAAKPAQRRASGSGTARGRAGASSRTAPGGTKSAVLAALKGGAAMTAGEVAAATGLGRGTVSTTLSKLARNNEIVKAERGYQLPGGAGNNSGSAS